MHFSSDQKEEKKKGKDTASGNIALLSRASQKA